MIDETLSFLRKMRMPHVFRALETYAKGGVLDIGGRRFFQYVEHSSSITFTSWTCLEQNESASSYDDPRYRLVVGDGEKIPFPDNSFDTAVNIQVLEHTMNPNQMVHEIARVLKPGGNGIFLIPQTSALHEIPTHYYNFTRYWVEKAFAEAGLTIRELIPVGGRWSTHASHMVYFFLEAFRYKTFSSQEYKRNVWFYILLPFMAVYAVFGIVFGMIFSIGDLTEDPNNLLVVAVKK